MSVIETIAGALYVPEHLAVCGAVDYHEINKLKHAAESASGGGYNMYPNPMLMLMKNMRQREHGPAPYDGILGAHQEKVVFTHDEANMWVEDTYKPGERFTLIEIKVVDDGVA